MQTHPIHQRVHDPAEIASLFDSISYEKGANVIAMIEDFVGQDYFRESISRYLNRYSLSNASEKDLWRSMEEVLRRHGKAMKIYETMSSWLKRPGYPVVYVTKKKRFKLTQKRFVLAGDRREKPWPIPLSFFVTRGKVNVMFDGQSTHIVDNSDWIKLNYNETGFYRTMYSPELLQKLGHLISTGKLGAFDAWGVENDLFALLRRGRTGFDAYFDFVSKHLITTEQPLATSVVSHMAWIAMMYEANGRLGMISKNLTDAFLPLFLRLGWTKKSGENVLDSVLRANLVLLLGILGERSVLEKANSILEAFLRSGKIADMSVLGAAFQIVPYGYGGKTLMAKLKKLYKKADLPEIRLFALKALGMFKEKDALKKALAFAISKEVPLKDFLYLPTYVAINPHGRELFWPFVHSNWSRFFSSLTPGSLILRKLLEGLDFVSDDKTLKTVTKFFSESKNMRGDLDLGVRSSLETIKANIAFVKKNLTD
jgi:aminopeptidase N